MNVTGLRAWSRIERQPESEGASRRNSGAPHRDSYWSAANGRVSVETLSEQLGVSVVTVRRDWMLSTKRDCCGARTVARYRSNHYFTSNSGATNHFWRKEKHAADEKRRIGELPPRSSRLEKRLR